MTHYKTRREAYVKHICDNEDLDECVKQFSFIKQKHFDKIVFCPCGKVIKNVYLFYNINHRVFIGVGAKCCHSLKLPAKVNIYHYKTDETHTLDLELTDGEYKMPSNDYYDRLIYEDLKIDCDKAINSNSLSEISKLKEYILNHMSNALNFNELIEKLETQEEIIKANNKKRNEEFKQVETREIQYRKAPVIDVKPMYKPTSKELFEKYMIEEPPINELVNELINKFDSEETKIQFVFDLIFDMTEWYSLKFYKMKIEMRKKDFSDNVKQQVMRNYSSLDKIDKYTHRLVFDK